MHVCMSAVCMCVYMCLFVCIYVSVYVCICRCVCVCVWDIHYLPWTRFIALCKFSIIPPFEVRAMEWVA